MRRTCIATTVVVAATALLASCDPHALLADDLLWVFSRRDAYQLPDDDAAATREVFTATTGDGVRLRGLWLPAAAPAATCRPAVLYCQGQSDDLQDHYPQLKLIRDLGYDVLTVDYRGNGMSEGETTREEHSYADAQAAAAELRRRVAGQPIVYYGESLGGAVCAELALRARPDALHLDCTFASIELFVRDGARLPIPGGYLTTVKYDTLSKIGRVGVPLQLFHGAADDFIRPRHSEILYDAAAGPKELWLVPGADHGTDELVEHPDFGARLAPFLDGVCAGR